MDLERKFSGTESAITVSDDLSIEGYASIFDAADRGGDRVARGAYAASLATGRAVKMLWQHDPAQPIGVWSEVREDAKGLYVKGRLLDGVARATEAAALIRAGAIDGLSIGYRTVRSSKNDGGGRLLMELELWEVSLVTFPMLPSARVAAKGTALDDTMRELAAVFDDARLELSGH
ncbi:HK97 family phage prohead protease [Pseudooceanicola onchidii]|uniref:HK97 family phage prohead protease n=1 Tax=Pseudooceanicola onchidii TaxID=2562279 RepID=UPI0010A9F1B9|nr:HK97 family phage prohead protease [Pseudooceanicola onchidii]